MKFNKIGVLFILSLMLMSSFVAAQNIDFRRGSESVINFFIEAYEPFLQVLFGGDDYTGFLLFEKFLIYMLLLAIVYIALSNVELFSDNRAILIIVSLIVPLLSVRYMNLQWINTVLLQYLILGTALTAILPFIIYLYFLHGMSESSTVRKIGWIFFIAIYLGLWATAANTGYASVYLWTMLAALIFLLMDGTIHRYLAKQKYGSGNRWKYIMDLREEKVSVQKAVTGGFPERKAKRLLKKIDKKIAFWMKQH
jgi:hypothetical protein